MKSRGSQLLLAAVAVLMPLMAYGAASKVALSVTPVPFTAVKIDDDFWSPRARTNREQTIPHILAMCEREGRVRNMWRAAGRLDGPFEGTRHHDADLLKAIEAAAYCLATYPDDQLQKRLEGIIGAVAAAQRDDGYLHSYVQVTQPDRHERTNLQLFAAGHLVDAAVAYCEATGDRRLLEVATGFADLIDSLLGPEGRRDVPSHPKIEASLVRLYRLTRQERYLNLARFLVDERGRAELSGRRSYGLHCLDHRPVREHQVAEGHVICGLFLCEGMFDVGVETGDAELIAACRQLLDDAVTRKMYVTGAMGRAADERFTEPYALDNRTSIGEGCQSAALVRIAHRLLLLEADARYADVIERVLYNNLAANVSLDGKRFYYVNRLSARDEDATGRPYTYPLTETVRERLPRFCLARQPWFRVPCCPPNVAMTIATLGGYVYARSDEAVYVNLYMGSEAAVTVAETQVRLTQQTRYPWDGRVKITVHPAEPRSFDLCLRIPDWCRGLESTGGLYRNERPVEPERVAVNVNDDRVPLSKLHKGYLRLRRTWHRGDVVELRLPMSVMRITSHPKVAAGAGRVALGRGPVVYCVEAVDHGGSVRGLWLPAEAELAAEYRPDLLGAITVLQGTAMRWDEGAGANRPVHFLAIPYATWCNRQPGEMDVWLPERPPGQE